MAGCIIPIFVLSALLCILLCFMLYGSEHLFAARAHIAAVRGWRHSTQSHGYLCWKLAVVTEGKHCEHLQRAQKL